MSRPILIWNMYLQFTNGYRNMRILTITAQKPHSTGSGYYLTEMVRGFTALGYEQAVLAGVYKEDTVDFPDGTAFYPVHFKSEELPFPIAGMSDEMPYESTVYGQMTEEMIEKFKSSFASAIRKAAEEFQPDLVICHHLYLVTSIAREVLPECRVCGFCHNTDLRQMKKIPLEREYIRTQIPKLDAVYALHEEQKQEIMEIYPVEEDKITVVGSGYNASEFHRISQTEAAEENVLHPYRIIYVGKIAEKKGVESLVRSLRYLHMDTDELEVNLVGGAGNHEEYQRIKKLAEESRYPVRLLGRLSQDDLVMEYNRSDLFVLASYSEGLPLTIIEAMACGCKVIVTDLPGIRPWVSANVEHAPIFYLEPPEMVNTDEPIPDSLEIFEKRLAELIEESRETPYPGLPDLSRISWENICRKVLCY